MERRSGRLGSDGVHRAKRQSGKQSDQSLDSMCDSTIPTGMRDEIARLIVVSYGTIVALRGRQRGVVYRRRSGISAFAGSCSSAVDFRRDSCDAQFPFATIRVIKNDAGGRPVSDRSGFA